MFWGGVRDFGAAGSTGARVHVCVCFDDDSTPDTSTLSSSGWCFFFCRLWNNVHANRRRCERKIGAFSVVGSQPIENCDGHVRSSEPYAHGKHAKKMQLWALRLRSRPGKCVRVCRSSDDRIGPTTWGGGWWANCVRLVRGGNCLRNYLGLWALFGGRWAHFLAGLAAWLREIRLPTALTLLVEKRPRNTEPSVFISSARVSERVLVSSTSRLPATLPIR